VDVAFVPAGLSLTLDPDIMRRLFAFYISELLINRIHAASIERGLRARVVTSERGRLTLDGRPVKMRLLRLALGRGTRGLIGFKPDFAPITL
jgi:hypothetical protein